MLFALILILAFPFVAERVQYALTRGHEAARADVAKELLADLPAAELRSNFVQRPRHVLVERLGPIAATEDEQR